MKRFFKIHSHNKIFKALAGLGRASNRFYENKNHDLYSNGELTVLKKIAKFNPLVIIDGGANVGTYSLMINTYCPGAHVYAFEPVKATFEKLKENLAGRNQILPIEQGLYKSNCTKPINLYVSDEHSSLYDLQVLSEESNGKETVELVSGDDFMKNNKIDEVDFLKIDIEGAEYDALLGFEKAITDGKIKAVQFEYGYLNISTKNLLVDFYNYFETKGYLLGKVFPKTVEFRKYECKYEDFLGPNFIAVKHTETELIHSLKNK